MQQFMSNIITMLTDYLLDGLLSLEKTYPGFCSNWGNMFSWTVKLIQFLVSASKPLTALDGRHIE